MSAVLDFFTRRGGQASWALINDTDDFGTGFFISEINRLISKGILISDGKIVRLTACINEDNLKRNDE